MKTDKQKNLEKNINLKQIMLRILKTLNKIF